MLQNFGSRVTSSKTHSYLLFTLIFTVLFLHCLFFYYIYRKRLQCPPCSVAPSLGRCGAPA